MLLAALLFLIFVLAVVRPLAQRQRERDLAERLKHTRDRVEASLIMDDAIRQNRREGRFLAKVRESYEFWLR